jgi:NADPH:quinone reductase-like Zn-dependent oxidoreductase
MDQTPATSTSTMRAITQSRYGTSDVLRLADVPVPRPGEGQVLLRVHAAGLDRGTEHLMTGKPYAVRLAMGVRRPRNPVLGRDVAGTVAETGPGVTRFAPGDEVYGVAPGSFAQYAVADVDKLATKPAALSYAEAAVVPISAGTALQAVRDAATVTSGQSRADHRRVRRRGSYAVQLAVAAGAEVTAVCSLTKRDHVTALGAQHVLDYAADDWADGSERYDVILDIAGNPSLRRLRRALTPTGQPYSWEASNPAR